MNIIATFDTPAELLDWMLGPEQHDHHVLRYRRHERHRKLMAAYARLDELYPR